MHQIKNIYHTLIINKDPDLDFDVYMMFYLMLKNHKNSTIEIDELIAVVTLTLKNLYWEFDLGSELNIPIILN
jgi:hypothetical protein